MWPRRTRAVLVELSIDGARVHHDVGAAPVIVPQSVGLATLDALAGPVTEVLSGASAQRVDLVIDGSLARHWLQSLPVGLRSLREAEELLQSRAAQLFGDALGWQVVADWHPTAPFVCAAVPGPAMRLAHTLRTSGGFEVRTSTWLTRVLAAPPAELVGPSWLVVAERTQLHLVHVDRARVDQLQGVAIAPVLSGNDRQALAHAEVRRAAALAGGLAATPVQLVTVAA